MRIFFILFLFSLHSLETHLFYTQLFQPAPAWMEEQIENDLAPFESELSRKSIDELFHREGERLYLVRVQIWNGKISVEKSDAAKNHSVPDKILDGIFKLNQLAPLPDLDLLFSAHDTISYGRPWSNTPGAFSTHSECPEPIWPIFIESKCEQDPGLILLPDRFALHGYQPEKNLVLEGNCIYPWEMKINRLFFRGSDTGVIFDPVLWRESPRPKLVSLSLQYPDIIDAKFLWYLHYRDMIESAWREGYIVNERVSMKDHPYYKYLMDIDGNCASCPRTATLLHSNSVILKQVTPSIQWFYRLLKPYEHFIPVDENLTDLLTQIEWAKQHDHECKMISENARRLAFEALTDERIYQYLYKLLMEYAKKQKVFYDDPHL